VVKSNTFSHETLIAQQVFLILADYTGVIRWNGGHVLKREGKPFWGIVLVVLGVLMILNQLNLFRFSWLWGFSAPVILFVIAFFFVAGFMSKGPSSAGLLVPAGVLGGVGLTLLLGTTFGLMYFVWPGFILAPAIGLLLMYLFSHEHNPGLLVPVGILVTVAGTCFLSTLLRMWHILWPGFILSPAVGLLLLYWFGERQNKGLLIPVGILGGISFFGFFGTFLMGNYGYGKYGLALALIVIGLLTLLKKPGRRAVRSSGKTRSRREPATIRRTRGSAGKRPETASNGANTDSRRIVNTTNGSTIRTGPAQTNGGAGSGSG
jgi:predicted membrane protein